MIEALHLFWALLVALVFLSIPAWHDHKHGFGAEAATTMNCTNNLTSWTVSESNMYLMQLCPQVLNLNINFGSLTSNYTNISFPYLQYVYGSLTVQFTNSAQLKGTLEFPALKEVSGRVTVYTSGTKASVGKVSFPVLENIFGSGMSIYTSGGGVIGSVYVSPSNPLTTPLNIGGSVYFSTTTGVNDSSINQIGPIQFEGLASVTSFQLSAGGGPFSGLTINKNSPTVDLTMIGTFYFNSQYNSNGSIGFIEIYGLVIVTSITFDARSGALAGAYIEGSGVNNLRVVGYIYLLTRNWYDNYLLNGSCYIGNVVFEKVWRVGGVRLESQIAPIGDFSINANTPGLNFDVNAGEIGFTTSNSANYSTVGNVFLRGVSIVRGSIRAVSNGGTIGNIKINDPTDPCQSVSVDGSIYAQTQYNTTAGIGHFEVHGVTRVYSSVYAYLNMGFLESFTVTGGTCTDGFDVTYSVYIQSSSYSGSYIGPFTVKNIRNIYGTAGVYPTGTPFTNPIVFSGTAEVPMAVSGYINVDTANLPYVTSINTVLFDQVSLAGYVRVYSDNSYINSVTINGHKSGFIVYNNVVFGSSYSNNSDYSIRNIAVTNLIGLEGGLQFSPGQGKIGNVSLSACSNGTSAKYIILQGSTATVPQAGSVESFSITGLRTIYVYINIQPLTTKYAKVAIHGTRFPIGGYIYVAHGVTDIGTLSIQGVKSMASYIGIYNNLINPTGTYLINTDESLNANITLEVATYVEVKSNVGVRIAAIQNVGSYFVIDSSTSYPQLPVVINGTKIPGLDVFNFVRVSSTTPYNRSVTFNNLRIIRGGSMILSNGQSFFSVYRTSANAIGPVMVDDVDVVAQPPYTGSYYYYSSTNKGNDPGCVNLCNGRGTGANSTSSKCGLPCKCWAYNEGANCEIERVCDYAPTCDCVCGSGWSAWEYVNSNSSYRIRTCDTTNTSLSCDTTQLQGAVDCIEGVEYQIAPPTPTTHRVCSPVSPQCDLDQYESKPPTVTSDRVCKPITSCLYGQYETEPPTLYTDRKCATWSKCPALNYIAATGTFTSDTVCSPCSDCGGGLIVTPCASNADAQCRDCSTCDLKTEYIVTPCLPTLSLDIECGTCTVCDPVYEFQISNCGEYDDRVCGNFTVCDPDTQFQRVPGTHTTDRICNDLQVCTPDPNLEFQSVAPTATSDRTCQTTTGCSNLEYQTAAPTPTTNRYCMLLTFYDPVYEYVSVSNTLTTDRVVKNVTTCKSYQYISVPHTYSTDRTCKNATVCTPVSQYQIVALTATTDRVCNATKVCDPGTQIQYSPPTATTDRKCVALGECIYTEYESKPPTPTTQRVCSLLTVCDEVTQFESVLSTPTSNRICKNYTLCQSNTQYEFVVRTPTSDPVCHNVTSCITDLEYESAAPSETSDRECSSLTACDVTQVMVEDYTPTSDRVCAPLTECGPVGASEFQTQGPTATTDRVCTSLTVCSSGSQYQTVAATLTSDRKCKNATICPVNTYQNKTITATSDRQCKSVKTCVPDLQYELKPPSPTTDRACVTYKTCIATLQYEATPPTATTDRKCLSYTTCKNYQKEAGIPTPTSDRECVNDYCHQLDPCQSHGNCSLIGTNSYSCDCFKPFYGKSCSLILPFCSAAPSIEDICMNGAICYKNGTTPYCNCTAGYTGFNCSSLAVSGTSDASSSSFVGSSSFIAVVAAVAGALILLVLIVYIVAARRHEAQKPFNSQVVPQKATFENPLFDGEALFKGPSTDDEFYTESMSPYEFAQNGNNRSMGAGSQNYDYAQNGGNRSMDGGSQNYDYAQNGGSNRGSQNYDYAENPHNSSSFGQGKYTKVRVDEEEEAGLSPYDMPDNVRGSGGYLLVDH